MRAFLIVATQWRTSLRMIEGGAVSTLWIGLDYAGAKVALDAVDMAITPRLWAQLLTIETAARDALNGDS